jgi:hypothetical protein
MAAAPFNAPLVLRQVVAKKNPLAEYQRSHLLPDKMMWTSFSLPLGSLARPSPTTALS